MSRRKIEWLRFIKLVPVLTVARSIWIYKRTTGAGESAVSRSSFFMFISFRDSIITAFIALPAFLNNR